MPVTRSVIKNYQSKEKGSSSAQSETSIDSDALTTSRRKRQDKHNAVRNLQGTPMLGSLFQRAKNSVLNTVRKQSVVTNKPRLD